MEQAQENRDNNEKTNAQWRIQESQICVLTRRFRDTMTHYNQETVSHSDRCKKAIIRELEMGRSYFLPDSIGIYAYSTILMKALIQKCCDLGYINEHL
jgi:hypothetical protein